MKVVVHAQEIDSKNRRMTVDESRISMPIMNSGLSRTGSMIEIQRSWYACATSQAMEFVVRDR